MSQAVESSALSFAVEFEIKLTKDDVEKVVVLAGEKMVVGLWLAAFKNAFEGVDGAGHALAEANPVFATHVDFKNGLATAVAGVKKAAMAEAAALRLAGRGWLSDIDSFRKDCLLKGIDDVDLTSLMQSKSNASKRVQSPVAFGYERFGFGGTPVVANSNLGRN
ncbi:MULTISPECIES: hypothetical protein [unclassified Bradyrhizobium]|uniref:hypothetical protein n=1 Tax=unclassified Bradyrhizobium TaxID=2631580 RepID=UPI001BA9D123|nr:MULTISPECIES: hypothetical protein [unclassified Bradyrhizobium]MBR1201837.1 hypothetical protein [Bradyrhizobium sp. AUGA SZCCT0124]MBR1311594.1 hypothetical protein [Bradyrhizobium sp. AUGA SZCCT0051]MBR1338786.1 hypothetical protein [Bradyrhizobium sp. AUGA SZCCT0105]MBR1353360.1 hypothetical protein [Bradyrhizobium sp. AUGA SZCCT0045]